GDLIRFGTPGVTSVMARLWLAWSYAELGEFAAALHFGEEAVRLADEVGNLYSRIGAHFSLGVAQLRKGDLPQAISCLEAARDLGGRSDIQFWRPWPGRRWAWHTHWLVVPAMHCRWLERLVSPWLT